MHFSLLSVCTAIVGFASFVPTVRAHPVISEVMWAGSDLSSSDEWFELALPSCDANEASCGAWNLGGYTVTYLKSTGIETVMVTFPNDFMIEPGQYLIISHFSADASRLLSEPALVASSISLLNSGLRLTLKDSSGTVIDEVDDGIGVPFAGANPSAPSPKASMERIDLMLAGTIKKNWRTATTSFGLDEGAIMLATPGFENGTSEAPSSGSSSSSSSSESSSISSEIFASSGASVSSATSESSSSCSSDLSVDILLQSGEYSGTEKVTLNVQAVATSGTLVGSTCFFHFGDGYRSESCNPPAHSYVESGIFILNLEVKNQCGNTLIQSRTVTVLPDQNQSVSSGVASGTSQAFDDARMIISGILPNPDDKDTDREWIELKNLEDREVSLSGWHLAVGEKTVRRFPFEAVRSIGPSASVRLYQSETGIALSNASGKVELVNPQGIVVSSVHWEKAIEGIVYRSDAFKIGSLLATVESVIDIENFRVTFDGPSSRLIGQNDATVRLIGISRFDTDNSPKLLALQSEYYESVRALLEKKKVELFFDTDVWDTDGSLLAYVMLDDGRILQKELLLSGFAIADTSSVYSARKEFIDAQKKAILAESGIWSFVQSPEPSYGGRAQEEDKKIAYTTQSGVEFGSGAFAKILITEVFPSPSSKHESGSLLKEEWIEFLNSGPADVSLDGWSLRIGKKSVFFGESSILQSGKHTVLFVSQVGLKLRNDGDEIELLSPEGISRIILVYPRTKIGNSYVYDELIQSYCESKRPSGGSSGLCSSQEPTIANEKSIASSKKTKPRASVYDKYAASYRAGIQGGESDGNIIVGFQEEASSSSMLFIAFLGMMLGSMGSVLAMKIIRNPFLVSSN